MPEVGKPRWICTRLLLYQDQVPLGCVPIFLWLRPAALSDGVLGHCGTRFLEVRDDLLAEEAKRVEHLLVLRRPDGAQ